MEALGSAGGCGLCYGGESKYTLCGLSRICPTLPEQPSGHGYGCGVAETYVVLLYSSSRSHCRLPGLCVSVPVCACMCVMDFLRGLCMLLPVYVYMLTILEARSPR